MVKPDGVARGLSGEVMARFERKGLKVIAAKMMLIPKELAERHYAEHVGKPFYGKLLAYISSGPVLAMVLEGKDAYAVARQVIGATNPSKAETGTIRGDLAVETGRNVVHGSDSPESAKREIALFFTEKELMEYERSGESWLYE